jgi:hypothetical protein
MNQWYFWVRAPIAIAAAVIIARRRPRCPRGLWTDHLAGDVARRDSTRHPAPATNRVRWWVQIFAHVAFVTIPLVFTTRRIFAESSRTF